MNEQLMDILKYYRDTYVVVQPIEEIYDELMANGVEINGSSFYCPIWNDDLGATILLAGTKEHADMWVLKKIIGLIKSGEPIYTMFNGNSEYLLSVFSRYNVKVVDCKDNLVYVSFNIKD